MLLVPRRVRWVNDPENPARESRPEAMDEFRNRPAWVLLGEPGAGKTEALKAEKEAAGGEYLSIAEFVQAGDVSRWRGMPLFLDGLDEVRGGSDNGSTLLRVRERLRTLGNPRFRIACRAADRFGATDRADIEGASPDGRIAVLFLEPLRGENILAILGRNHGIEDPVAFVERVEALGLSSMLDNPQTLGLLAQAIRGERGEWPKTRQDTFLLACRQLAEEANKRHRDKARHQLPSTEQLLDAAGQLCAVLLLSDKTGVALDPERANERFPYLWDCAPPDAEAASRAVGTKLFRPENEERFVPSHRSIAEFLAARWLAAQIDQHGLPLGRILNLMFGRDGRTVAGLRGLYGWFALYCQGARTRLIEADPLTVVVYGDPKPLPREDKRRILAGLRREAEHHGAFHQDATSAHAFGALADAGLAEDFIAALTSPERDDTAQSFAYCIANVLAEGEVVPALAATLKDVVADDTRWGAVRTTALRAWMGLQPEPQEAVALLDEINEDRVADPDDELAGGLLRHLYPKDIAAESLLSYLHVPKERNLFGSYVAFWGGELPTVALESHLPVLLDRLAARSDLPWHDADDFHLKRIAGALLSRGLEVHGTQVNNERLFAWLGIGFDEYGDSRREETDRATIAKWIETHPDLHKALLSLCFARCQTHRLPRYCIDTLAKRLHGAAAPEDLGRWHLEQASVTDDDKLAQVHLSAAVEALMYDRGSRGLTLEQIVAWGDSHPEKKDWLRPLLAWEIPEGRLKRNVRIREIEQKRSDTRRARTIHVNEHVPAIRSGTAGAGVMHELAGVWMSRYADIPGSTPAERFESYCENGLDVLAAAESGFLHCPARNDLPTVGEIIDTAIHQREHFIRRPCLVGMELRWRQGQFAIASLSDECLRRMLAFRLTDGTGGPPQWFAHLVVQCPSLVAEVLAEYASAAFGSKLDYVNCIHLLGRDPDYREVATIAVPRLLERFPVRARSTQLRSLEHLLKAALRYDVAQLPALVKSKTALKGIDVAQRVFWLTAGMLLDAEQYEASLWRYVGKSWARANHLAEFLSQPLGGPSDDYRLSSGTLARLIELLAPHAELEWGSGGTVTDAMRRGDQVSALITRLGSLATDDAAREIDRLLAVPALRKLKFALETARHQLRSRQRESGFRFLPLSGVVQVLANEAPASAADLAALVLDHLDELAGEIRHENDDGFRAFWNIEHGKAPSKRAENHCRDALLSRLRARLRPFGIDCQPEADRANDKRADILVSFRNEFELPIEIKRDDNDSLWTALRAQLIARYANAPRAAGHGIYLVLWFGLNGLPGATDGGKRPRSPEELRARLEAQLDPSERRQVFVRVLDVSWPA